MFLDCQPYRFPKAQAVEKMFYLFFFVVVIHVTLIEHGMLLVIISRFRNPIPLINSLLIYQKSIQITVRRVDRQNTSIPS